jgi:hypothetical protein
MRFKCANRISTFLRCRREVIIIFTPALITGVNQQNITTVTAIFFNRIDPKQTTEAVGLFGALTGCLRPLCPSIFGRVCATHQGLQQHGARIGLGRVAKLVQPLDHPIEVTSPLVALRLERNPLDATVLPCLRA